MFDPPIVLARLEREEYQAFFDAEIPYSGATGIDVAEGGGFEGRYIVTSFRHVHEVTSVLKWTRFKVLVINGQWVMRRDRPRPRGRGGKTA